MKPKTKKALAVAGSVAAVIAVIVTVYLLWRKKRNGGILVIGGAGATVQNNSIMDITQENTGSSAASNHFGDTSLPLGYRNNNPLNILYGASLWKGKVIPNTDTSKPRKEQFISMAYGYRAALYLLRKHIRGGYNTLARLVNRWGTGAKSDAVTSYVSFVASKSGIAAESVVNADDRETMCRIAYAMAQFENGKKPSSMDDIYLGWSLL